MLGSNAHVQGASAAPACPIWALRRGPLRPTGGRALRPARLRREGLVVPHTTTPSAPCERAGERGEMSVYPRRLVSYQRSLILTHFTALKGRLARRGLAPWCGAPPAGRPMYPKGAARRPLRAAFGGANWSSGVVATLDRCPGNPGASHGAPRLPRGPIRAHEMGQYQGPLV